MAATPILLGQYPLYLAQRSGYYDARHLRLPWADAFQTGALDPGDFAPAATSPASMAIDFGSAAYLSKAWIKGDPTAELGGYRVSYSGKTTADVASNSAGQPRVDSYYLIIEDAQIGGGLANDFTIDVRAGTPTAGAQITAPQTTATYRAGAAAAPTQPYMRLCDVLVASGAGSITAANIVDRRPWARGAYAYAANVAGDYNVTVTTAGTSAGASRARRRLEIVTGLVEASWTARAYTNAGAFAVATGVIVAGPGGAVTTGALGGGFVTSSAVTIGVPVGFTRSVIGVTPGSNLFDVWAYVASGTAVFLDSSGSPAEFILREVPNNAASAHNGLA